jgi:hypothetical protein
LSCLSISVTQRILRAAYMQDHTAEQWSAMTSSHTLQHSTSNTNFAPQEHDYLKFIDTTAPLNDEIKEEREATPIRITSPEPTKENIKRDIASPQPSAMIDHISCESPELYVSYAISLACLISLHGFICYTLCL